MRGREALLGQDAGMGGPNVGGAGAPSSLRLLHPLLSPAAIVPAEPPAGPLPSCWVAERVRSQRAGKRPLSHQCFPISCNSQAKLSSMSVQLVLLTVKQTFQTSAKNPSPTHQACNTKGKHRERLIVNDENADSWWVGGTG